MKKENLVLIAEGLQTIAGAFLAEAGATTTVASTKITQAVEEAVKVVKEVTVNEEQTTEAEATEGYTEVELKAMKVADLKAIADDAELEYSSKPTKAELVALILEAQESGEEAEEAEEEEEEVADAEEADEDEDEDESEGDELTAEDLKDMSLAELKELADEYEITYAKTVKAPKLVEVLIAELFTDEEEEEEAEEEGDELSAEDLEEMSLTELKSLADEYEVKYSKMVKAPKLRELLIAELFTEDESEETDLDETDHAEELGLNDMEIDELAEILAEHELNAKGKKQALIARIVEAIEDGTIVLDDEEEGK